MLTRADFQSLLPRFEVETFSGHIPGNTEYRGKKITFLWKKETWIREIQIKKERNMRQSGTGKQIGLWRLNVDGELFKIYRESADYKHWGKKIVQMWATLPQRADDTKSKAASLAASMQAPWSVIKQHTPLQR